MMRQVNKTLSLEERTEAERFFERIGERDAATVRSVIGVVDAQADDYFSSEALDRIPHYFEGGEAFFAVYGIGGNVTKEGKRPDVDVMIVTNMRYREGFHDISGDKMDDPQWEKTAEPLWRRIHRELRDDMEIVKEGELPDNYNLGITKGKCLITLTPHDGARTVDVVYVKSMALHGDPAATSVKESPQDTFDTLAHSFKSEREFVSKDVGPENEQLARVLLYRANTNDIMEPPETFPFMTTRAV